MRTAQASAPAWVRLPLASTAALVLGVWLASTDEPRAVALVLLVGLVVVTAWRAPLAVAAVLAVLSWVFLLGLVESRGSLAYHRGDDWRLVVLLVAAGIAASAALIDRFSPGTSHPDDMSHPSVSTASDRPGIAGRIPSPRSSQE